jgi:hypothetical protein
MSLPSESYGAPIEVEMTLACRFSHNAAQNSKNARYTPAIESHFPFASYNLSQGSVDWVPFGR